MRERSKNKVRDKRSDLVICDPEDPDSNPETRKKREENNSLPKEWTVSLAHSFQLGEKETFLSALV